MNAAARALATVLVVGALAACTSSPDSGPTAGQTMSAVTDPETGCGPVEHPGLQVATHLVGDAEPPSPYTSVPPTSGWHAPEAPRPGLHDAPLRDPEIVAALESGIVVLAVEPDLLDSTVVSDLVAQFPDRLLAVGYTEEMPTPVALLTWGALQRCPEVDRATATSFVLDQRTSAEH